MLLALGVWLHSADTLVTATIAPDIVAALGGIAYINWTLSLYEVGAIIAGAASTVLCLRLGIRRVFLGSTLLYAVGCLTAAVAPTMAALIAGRFVQGMGGGMLLTLCYIALEEWFAPAQRRRLFSIITALWGVGSLAGPLIGGAFSGVHWRGAFWSFAIQAVALFSVAFRVLPDDRHNPRAAPSTHPRSGAQWPVVPLAVLTLATLIIAEAGATADGTVFGARRAMLPALSGSVIGLALLYVAARLDACAAVRLLPSTTLDIRRPLGAGLLMVFALAVGTTGFWVYGPLILKILFGTRPVVTGYIIGGEAIAWSLASLAVARAAESADAVLIRIGIVCVAVGAAGFALVVPGGSFIGIVLCGLLQGGGFGLCWPAIVERAARHAPADERAIASAAVSTVQRIGYAVGTAAVGIAGNLSGLADGVSVHAAKAAGFWVFAAFVPVLGVGIAAAWRFTVDPRHPP